jgi:hypothetical protein
MSGNSRKTGKNLVEKAMAKHMPATNGRSSSASTRHSIMKSAEIESGIPMIPEAPMMTGQRKVRAKP